MGAKADHLGFLFPFASLMFGLGINKPSLMARLGHIFCCSTVRIEILALTDHRHLHWFIVGIGGFILEPEHLEYEGNHPFGWVILVEDVVRFVHVPVLCPWQCLAGHEYQAEGDDEPMKFIPHCQGRERLYESMID